MRWWYLTLPKQDINDVFYVRLQRVHDGLGNLTKVKLSQVEEPAQHCGTEGADPGPRPRELIRERKSDGMTSPL